jgi:nucleoside-diphosphate-sugar epimerase
VTDIRNVTEQHLEGIDAVVHMAELSNDPTGQLAPHITHAINFEGSVRLARLAKTHGSMRFIYMSSCSVYGAAEGGFVNESSPVNPLTAYAECKVLVESSLRRLADDRFTPVILRNATAFGASPRMRFDLVLNNLAGLAWTTGEVAMVSDGTPWRPLVHAADIAHAIRCALDAPAEAVHAETFNVGSTEQNYRVREIAEIVAESFPGSRLRFGDSGTDDRSYRVEFDRIHERLPGFTCSWDARRGVTQLRRIFEHIDLDTDAFQGRSYTRLKQLEYLLRTRQLDSDFFWRPVA